MGILSARAPIVVFLWVYPLVCAGGSYHKTWRYSVTSEKGSFRNARTSDGEENSIRVKISTSIE